MGVQMLMDGMDTKGMWDQAQPTPRNPMTTAIDLIMDNHLFLYCLGLINPYDLPTEPILKENPEAMKILKGDDEQGIVDWMENLIIP